MNQFDDGPRMTMGSGGSADTILSPGTAKNVITVGALEQPRGLTNQVWKCVPDNTSTNGQSCQTNQPWLPSSDSDDQVAGFSSRGNVGIGLEGPSGRFKPDVVAPGSVVVSTRSANGSGRLTTIPPATLALRLCLACNWRPILCSRTVSSFRPTL